MPSHQELIALGKKALGDQNAKEAISALRAALEQKPDDANTLLLLAQALERDEQLPQAQKAWLWCASRVRSPTMPLHPKAGSLEKRCMWPPFPWPRPVSRPNISTNLSAGPMKKRLVH